MSGVPHLSTFSLKKLLTTGAQGPTLSASNLPVRRPTKSLRQGPDVEVWTHHSSDQGAGASIIENWHVSPSARSSPRGPGSCLRFCSGKTGRRSSCRCSTCPASQTQTRTTYVTTSTSTLKTWATAPANENDNSQSQELTQGRNRETHAVANDVSKQSCE